MDEVPMKLPDQQNLLSLTAQVARKGASLHGRIAGLFRNNQSGAFSRNPLPGHISNRRRRYRSCNTQRRRLPFIRILCQKAERCLQALVVCWAPDAASTIALPISTAEGDSHQREDGHASSLGQRAYVPQADPTVPPLPCFLGSPLAVSGRLSLLHKPT